MEEYILKVGLREGFFVKPKTQNWDLTKECTILGGIFIISSNDALAFNTVKEYSLTAITVKEYC